MGYIDTVFAQAQLDYYFNKNHGNYTLLTVPAASLKYKGLVIYLQMLVDLLSYMDMSVV